MKIKQTTTENRRQTRVCMHPGLPSGTPL